MRRSARTTAPPDYLFIGVLFLLVVFGLVMLASASSDLAERKFGESYYYLLHQITYGLSFGVVGFLLGTFLYYRWWERFAVVLLGAGLIALILLFTPLGLSFKGGERWLSLGPISFQPGEFLKFAFLIYLASWIGKSELRRTSFVHGLLPFLILLGSAMGLLLAQPAITTALLLCAASLILYFTAGARLHFIVAVVLIAMFLTAAVIYFSPYGLTRVLTFLDPARDTLGSGYHVNQALIAIGSGGWTGVGFGQSIAKLKFLPEPIGDSIFAVIAEEFGFVGGVAVIFLFLLFVWRGFTIAKRAPDTFARATVTGFTALIGIQAFVNIAAVSGLIPMTGVPLPFISYGGTALAVFLTMSGIIVNVSRHRR